ncbi:Uncharacterised protein [Mycobacteroides abscessus subsp. abscessus]|nr:Uncharacterised protein [Mycobacteroides abscessus subsp. abscessus]
MPRSPAATTGGTGDSPLSQAKCSKLTSHSQDRSSPSGTWPFTAMTSPSASVSTIDRASCQPAGFLASSSRMVWSPRLMLR